jgi:hypothetical protein
MALLSEVGVIGSRGPIAPKFENLPPGDPHEQRSIRAQFGLVHELGPDSPSSGLVANRPLFVDALGLAVMWLNQHMPGPTPAVSLPCYVTYFTGERITRRENHFC